MGLYPAEGGLRFDPCIPAEWPGFEATLRVSGGEVHVVVENPERTGRGIRRLTLGGVELSSPLVHFTAAPGTRYEVHIVLGSAPAANPVPDDRPSVARAPEASP